MNPPGIDRRLSCQLLLKRKRLIQIYLLIFIIICWVRNSFIPSTKGIAFTLHFVFIWFKRCRCFTMFYKLRSIISSTFTVFIKDQPVASRRIYQETDIAFYRNGCFVLIYPVCRNNGSNIRHCCGFSYPTLKFVNIVLCRITLINCITDFYCSIFAGFYRYAIHTNSYPGNAFVSICIILIGNNV